MSSMAQPIGNLISGLVRDTLGFHASPVAYMTWIADLSFT